MEFEFDPAKSASNKNKHGIDFVEAQLLWRDPGLLTLLSRDDDDEERRMAIGVSNGIYWVAIFVYREGNIRIISARRARKLEIEIYEG
ncbi:BrnT family toxin [Pseudomonas sp. R2.Fl]|nr:BrnT family toxin [Pseudomonas sp. R2.Fl]